MPKGDKYKLKADPDDGTTPIANLLLEAVAMSRLSGVEKGAILYLWRRTYGWLCKGERLKEREIGLTEWADALDTYKTHASKVLKGLIAKNILLRRHTGEWQIYIYSINTHIDQWNSDSINIERLSNVSTVIPSDTVIQNDTVIRKRDITVIRKRNTTVIPSDTPLDTNSGVLKKDKEKKERTARARGVSFEQYFEELRSRYSILDIDAEWEKCKLWWEESGKDMKRPKLALRNWLDKAQKMFEQSGAEQPVKTIADYLKEEKDAGG